MEPMSALIIACVAAWGATRSAADAAVDQARAEARQAASAIRNDLSRRRTEWSDDLAERLTNGRSGGPSTALWWGWAAMRTYGAIRRQMRREPRTAEKNPRAIRGTTGPFRRIWDAGVRGGRYAFDEAIRQHANKQRPSRTPVGVCARCGVVSARAALAPPEPGSRDLMCAKCRVVVKTPRATGGTADRPHTPAPDVRDADIVDPPQVDDRRPGLDALPAGTPEEPARPTTPSPPSLPPALPGGEDGKPAKPAPAPVADAVSKPSIEGESVAPRTPGQVAVRLTATPAVRAAQAAARGSGGESYTHGQWNRSVADIEKRLEELPAALELMLQRLTSADAGRTQVQGVLTTNDRLVAFMEQIRAMLTEVNRREAPVLAAVEAAGGPDEIASIRYLSDV